MAGSKLIMNTETQTNAEEKIAEMKGIPTEDDLNKMLRENVLVVTFNKLDGDKRVMTCTKSFDHIPKENQPKTDKTPPKGNITVWDTNAKGWRSFKYNRVTNVDKA